MIWPPTISFIWRETVLELRRERLVAVTTISTVAVLFVLLGANLLFVLNLHGWAARAAREVQLFAYFKDGLGRTEAQQLTKTMATWPEVQQAQFVTREQTWQELTRSFGADKLRGLGPSVLSDSVALEMKRPTQVPGIAKRLLAMKEIETVNPDPAHPSRAGDFLQKVIVFNRAVSLIGLFVAALVALVGLFVVHNTIRLAMHARWRELYIMQLVGATRPLIAAPFLLQGAIQGALGAALASCLLVPVHMYLAAFILASKHTFLQLQPDAALLPFTLYLLLGGLVLGLFGSALSVRRVLRQKPEWQT